MFKLEFTESAGDDLRYFNKFEQVIILNAVEKQLVWEPTKETKSRKQLRPNELSKWELRIVSSMMPTWKLKPSRLKPSVGKNTTNFLFVEGNLNYEYH